MRPARSSLARKYNLSRERLTSLMRRPHAEAQSTARDQGSTATYYRRSATYPNELRVDHTEINRDNEARRAALHIPHNLIIEAPAKD